VRESAVSLASEGDLVVVGAGGFGRETVEAIRALNACGASWQLLGYLDDNPMLRGKQVDGTLVLGGLTEAKNMADAFFVVCTGRPDNYASRPRVVDRLGLPPDRYATIVHPAATVSSSSRIGPGSVLLANVVLTAAVTIGSHVAIMPNATITHDDIIDDFVTIASGVGLGGHVCIGQGAYVGAGALIREGRSVGKRAMVGMGSVVLADVPAGQVWTGIPARYLRDVDTPGTDERNAK
jgi:sugar O-acyltransferase (sialic acid O-acetyltransferase NeuD family)